MGTVREELVEVWMTPALRDALRAGVPCSVVGMNPTGHGTFALSFIAPQPLASRYSFPVSGPGSEVFRRG